MGESDRKMGCGTLGNEVRINRPAANRQNLTPHPEDWHHIHSRPVFWLAVFLLRRLPMQIRCTVACCRIRQAYSSGGLRRNYRLDCINQRTHRLPVSPVPPKRNKEPENHRGLYTDESIKKIAANRSAILAATFLAERKGHCRQAIEDAYRLFDRLRTESQRDGIFAFEGRPLTEKIGVRRRLRL